jgi:tight adherence protein B
MQLFVLFAIFLAVVGLVYGGYVLLSRGSLAATESAMARLQESEAAIEAVRSILRDEKASNVTAFDRFLKERDATLILQDRLRRAGVSINPAEFLLRALLTPLVTLVLGVAIMRGSLGANIAALVGLVIGAPLPWLWLQYKLDRRSRRFSQQLPEALDMIVSAMRAGYSFPAAMKLVGEEVQEPLGPEFLRFYEEQRLGVEVRVALLAILQRTPDLDLRMFVTAVLIQRETGGNLTEVLERLSTLMREREGFRGELETLTAESKMSARILGSLPFVVVAAILLMNPNFIAPVLESSVGRWAMAAAAFSVFVGYRIMMRIARIEY